MKTSNMSFIVLSLFLGLGSSMAVACAARLGQLGQRTGQAASAARLAPARYFATRSQKPTTIRVQPIRSMSTQAPLPWSTWNRPWDYNALPESNDLFFVRGKDTFFKDLSPVEKEKAIKSRKIIAGRLEDDFAELYEVEQKQLRIKENLKREYAGLDIQKLYEQWKLQPAVKKAD